jgi:hypothetical protein
MESADIPPMFIKIEMEVTGKNWTDQVLKRLWFNDFCKTCESPISLFKNTLMNAENTRRGKIGFGATSLKNWLCQSPNLSIEGKSC